MDFLIGRADNFKETNLNQSVFNIEKALNQEGKLANQTYVAKKVHMILEKLVRQSEQ